MSSGPAGGMVDVCFVLKDFGDGRETKVATEVGFSDFITVLGKLIIDSIGGLHRHFLTPIEELTVYEEVENFLMFETRVSKSSPYVNLEIHSVFPTVELACSVEQKWAAARVTGKDTACWWQFFTLVPEIIEDRQVVPYALPESIGVQDDGALSGKIGDDVVYFPSFRGLWPLVDPNSMAHKLAGRLEAVLWFYNGLRKDGREVWMQDSMYLSILEDAHEACLQSPV